MLTPLFDVANAGAVGGAGLLLGIAGIILTLIGFGITFYQIAKTRSAAEAVKAKTETLKNQITIFDVSVEIVKTNNALRQIIVMLRAKALANIFGPLEEAQSCLNRTSKLILDDSDTSELARSESEFLLSQIQLAEEAFDKGVVFDHVELMTRARRTINALETKLIDFQKGIYDA